MSGRPNFLYLITDQQRADHVGSYGNRVLQTPAIDSLAARGVSFDRFYVANPSCMPNRATMMTGRTPQANGVWSNGVPLSMRANTFVHLLRAAGYRTGLVGKCHLQAFTGRPPVIVPPEPGPKQLTPPPALRDAVIDAYGDGRYDQELLPRWRDDPDHELDLPYYGFDGVDLAILHGDKVHGHYVRWAKARHPDFESLPGPENELGGHDYNVAWAWRTRVPEDLYPTTYVEERTLAFLERHAQAKDGRPFFLQCSFPDPHHPFTPPGRYWGLYDPADVELPGSFGRTNNPPPHLAYLWQERDRGETNRWTHLPQGITEREAREAIALTYGMIAMIDGAIGRILAKLEALGLAEDTVVVFNSDHGDLLGDHQTMLKGTLHYQGLVRVPFIWVDPRRLGSGRSRALCGTLDLAPTFLERAGIAPYHDIQGRSLLPLIDDPSSSLRDSVYIEEDAQRTFMGFEVPPRTRTLITRDWRLSINLGVPWGELYHLAEDPYEMTNLWDDSAAAATRAELMEQLVQKMTQYANRAPLPTNRG